MLEELRLFTKKISYDQIPYAQAKKDALDWDEIEERFNGVGKKITKRKAEDLGLCYACRKNKSLFGWDYSFWS